MLVNFAWPRAASNPKPNQTGGLLSSTSSFLNGIPILWTVVIFIALIGAIYYLVAGRNKAFAPVHGAVRGRRPVAGTRGRGGMTPQPAGDDWAAAPDPGSRRRRSCASRAPPCTRRSRTGWPERSRSARWPPGDRLPTEQDLAAWFGVSRMTLRHALAELARRGLVTRAVGRHGGTFVAAPKLEQDLTTLAGFSEQLRRHGMVAGARVLSARPAPGRADRGRGPAARRGRPGV